jgi:hypothetical protein
MPPNANRPGGWTPPGPTNYQSHDDHRDAHQDSAGLCDLLDLVARLNDRVVDLELRLAGARVPHAPSALERQRRRRRARLERTSPVARFVADRERASR